MKITFIGAAHQVTGSRTLIEWQPGRFFLVDCGMEQGENDYEMAEMPVGASMIEYVFLSRDGRPVPDHADGQCPHPGNGRCE